MKKSLFFLALGLLMAGLSAQASEQHDGIWYEFDYVTGATVVAPPSGNYSGDIVIPETVQADDTYWYNVTAIGANAFYQCLNLKSVELPNSIKSIGSSAFFYCRVLESINWPEDLESIGNGAFSICDKLPSVHIGANVSSIGSKVFAMSISISEFTVDPANANFYAEDGVLFQKTPQALIAFPPASDMTEYEVPDGTVSILMRAFDECKLTNVSFPASLKTIGTEAFYHAKSLVAIELSEGLEKIENGAFSGCSAVESIAIPASVTSIGSHAFTECTGVKTIACRKTTPPTAYVKTFNEVPTTAILYVPDVAIGPYEADASWNKFTVKDIALAEKRAELYGLCDNMEDMISLAKSCGIPDSELTEFAGARTAALDVADNTDADMTALNSAIATCNLFIDGAFSKLKTDGPAALETALGNLLKSGDSQDCINIVTYAKATNIPILENLDLSKTTEEKLAILAPLATAVADTEAAVVAQRAQDEIDAEKENLKSVLDEMKYIDATAQTYLPPATPAYEALLQAITDAQAVYDNPSATLSEVQTAINDADNALSAAITNVIPPIKYRMKEQLLNLVAGEAEQVEQVALKAQDDIDDFTWNYLETTYFNIDALNHIYKKAQGDIELEKRKMYPSEITANSALITWHETWGTEFVIRYKKALIMDFETGLAPFTEIDNDGDGFTWYSNLENGSVNPADGIEYTPFTHSGNGIAYSQSYSNAGIGTALTPDNWLVSPLITLGGSIVFWGRGDLTYYYAEHFGFYISKTDNQVTSFTELQNWDATDAYNDYNIDYSGEEGKGYIAIRHFGCTDEYLLDIDDIEIYEGPVTDWTVVGPFTSTNFLLQGLDNDAYYSVQVSADGGSNWSAVCVFKTSVTTGIEEVSGQQSEVCTQKLLRNGQLFILRNGEMYNATGVRVK